MNEEEIFRCCRAMDLENIVIECARGKMDDPSVYHGKVVFHPAVIEQNGKRVCEQCGMVC